MAEHFRQGLRRSGADEFTPVPVSSESSPEFTKRPTDMVVIAVEPESVSLSPLALLSDVSETDLQAPDIFTGKPALFRDLKEAPWSLLATKL